MGGKESNQTNKIFENKNAEWNDHYVSCMQRENSVPADQCLKSWRFQSGRDSYIHETTSLAKA